MSNVVVEGTTCFVEQINITEFLPLVPNMQPANFRADMGMLYQKMCCITHTASCPVSQRKERLPAQVITLLDEIAQDKPLIWFEDTRSKLRHSFDLNATGWIPFQRLLLINQPLAQVFDDGLDASAMTYTIALFLEERQISFDNRHLELFRLKAFPVPWAFGNPFGELT